MCVAVTWMCTVLCLTVFVTGSQGESLRSDDGSLAGSKWKAFVRSYVETNVEKLDVDKQLSENKNELIGRGAVRVGRAREQSEVEKIQTKLSGPEMHSRRKMIHSQREMHTGGEISRQKRVNDKEMFCDHMYISGSDYIQRQKGAYSLSPTNEWCHFDDIELDEYDLPLYQQDNGPNYVFFIGVVWNIGPNKCDYSPDYWLYAYNEGKEFYTDPTQVESRWYYYYGDEYVYHNMSSMELECFLAGYTISPDVTCVGGTIAKSRTTDEPLETCLTHCYSREDCIAIGFHKNNRWCDLFSSCPSQANSADYDMFFKNSNVPDNCAFLNGGCDHMCTNDENDDDDYTCSYHTGYQLTADSHTCNKDVFEDLGDCSSNNGGCAHVCIVPPAGHICTCNRGYRLHDDGKSCTPDIISIEGEFTDCASLFDAGYVSTGVYDIKPPGFSSVITMLCDQQTSGGGWTVFQRRLDGTESFYRNWYDYKNGFGSLYKEFWLGLDALHAMTEHMYYDMTLRVELGGFQDEVAFAEYGGFTVADEDDAFKLNIGPSLAASGLSEDAMYLHNNLKFYTFDESHGDENLAERFQGGWWYRESAIHKTCVYACLNQRYYNYELSWNPYAITWNNYRYKHHSWKTTAMKFRPSNFCANRRHC